MPRGLLGMPRWRWPGWSRPARSPRWSSTSGARPAGRSSRSSPSPRRTTWTRSPSSASTSRTTEVQPKTPSRSPGPVTGIFDQDAEAVQSIDWDGVSPTTWFIDARGDIVHQRAGPITRPGGTGGGYRDVPSQMSAQRFRRRRSITPLATPGAGSARSDRRPSRVRRSVASTPLAVGTARPCRRAPPARPRGPGGTGGRSTRCERAALAPARSATRTRAARQSHRSLCGFDQGQG